MSNRFDYIEYDLQAKTSQLSFKNLFMNLEEQVLAQLKSPRSKALILTKIEEAYCWVGKAIRDDQIERNGTAELQEGRGKE